MSSSVERAARWLLAAALGAAFAASALAQPKAAANGGQYGLGRAPTAGEIAGWDIDVRPDGHGVRKGRGTVAQGQEIYDAQCASCHGTFGESNRYMALAGGVRPEDLKTGQATALKKPDGPRNLGTKLNAATTLWDYIYRAMPWTNPQSLSADEVYAVTAYVLHLNEIVPADFELNDRNLMTIAMPNRNGMTTAHGLGSVKGKPDVQGSACMKDCIKDVKVASQLPEFARNQHGNLAEQQRLLGPMRGIDTTRYESTAGADGAAGQVVASGNQAARAAPAKAAGQPGSAVADAKTLLTRNACTACHGLTSKILGPGFSEIAVRYQGKPDVEAYLVQKIRAGGAGVWGPVPMPPQSLKEEDARAIAQWIAAGAK